LKERAAVVAFSGFAGFIVPEKKQGKREGLVNGQEAV
jgi:hypothetical protein